MKKISMFIGLCLLANSLYAHEVLVKIELSPAGSFEAKSAKLKGEIKKDGNKFTAENLWVKTEELKTGIALRDEHFHKHLNFDKTPKITMTKVVAADGKGTGILSVNEVQRPINFSYKAVSPKKMEAVFKVKPSEFKLKEANYMSIGVRDEVEIVVLVDI